MKEKDLRGYAGGGIGVPVIDASTIAAHFLAAPRAIERGVGSHGYA
jgi:hypothetical protein